MARITAKYHYKERAGLHKDKLILSKLDLDEKRFQERDSTLPSLTSTQSLGDLTLKDDEEAKVQRDAIASSKVSHHYAPNWFYILFSSQLQESFKLSPPRPPSRASVDEEVQSGALVLVSSKSVAFVIGLPPPIDIQPVELMSNVVEMLAINKYSAEMNSFKQNLTCAGIVHWLKFECLILFQSLHWFL